MNSNYTACKNKKCLKRYSCYRYRVHEYFEETHIKLIYDIYDEKDCHSFLRYKVPGK